MSNDSMVRDDATTKKITGSIVAAAAGFGVGVLLSQLVAEPRMVWQSLCNLADVICLEAQAHRARNFVACEECCGRWHTHTEWMAIEMMAGASRDERGFWYWPFPVEEY